MKIDKQKLSNLLIGSTAIFTIYCISSILQQSLLTLPYQNFQTGNQQKLQDQAILIFVCDLIAWIISYCYNRIVYAQTQRNKIPEIDAAKSATVKFIALITYTWAVPITNYPVVMAFKSCNLLSVILVALLCTKVKQKNLKLTPKKLIVGAVISIGILIFSFFDPEKKNRTRQSQFLGILLLFISILADGFLPDLQAHIKSDYKPHPTQMMQIINKWVTIITLISMTASFTLIPSLKFIFYHPKFAIHLLLMAILATIGQFFIYRMIKQFKQHIVPFVITTRKILTVFISVVFLGHQKDMVQLCGIFIVFGGVVYQFVTEIRHNQNDIKIQNTQIERRKMSQQIIQTLQQQVFKDLHSNNMQNDYKEKAQKIQTVQK